MEDNKKLNRVFDRVKLSQEREEAILADLLREKKEVSSMKQTNRRRIPAAALVAVVLVIVLAGTALAENYFGRLDVSPIDGDYENGYEITGAFQNIPPERLSKEVLECAAQAGKGQERWVLSSWSEAEEFLGLEVADNPMLEEMAQSDWEPLHDDDSTPEDSRSCTVYMNYSLGLPDMIWLHADYFGGYFEEGPFGVNVDAFLRTTAAETEDLPFALGSGTNIENVNEEKYVTPSGIEVTIFTHDGTVKRLDGTSFQQSAYSAYFALNNAMFQLSTNFSEENADIALIRLKQVLDAYE